MGKQFRWLVSGAVSAIVAATFFFAWPALHVGASPSDTPIPVTPYSGFGASLSRAPYVTDLTQTSAYVNWATTTSTPGSVQVAVATNGSCPSGTTTWSPSAIAAPTSLPGPINGTSPTGTMTNHAFTVVATAEDQWSVPLTGLTAGTEYCYAVFSGDSSGATDLLPASQPDQLFTTLDPAGSTKSLTFDVVDDSAETYYSLPNSSFPGNLNTDQAALDKLIGQSGARFAVLAGDTAYNNGDQNNFGDLEQSGAEVSDLFGPSYWPETGGIPTFKANGDHGLNQESLQIFPTPNTASSSGGTYSYDSYSPGFGITSSFNEPDDWYAIQSGDVRIYVLDAAWNEQNNQGNSTGSLCPGNTSNCQQYEMDYNEHWQTSSAEYQWLSHDLASHPGGVKLAVFHYPFRSDTSSQPNDVYLQNSAANPNAATSLEKLLAANGVGAAFGGHAHAYTRVNPGQPGQQVPNYVAGTGGGVLEPVDGGSCDNAGASVYAIGWSPGTTPPTGTGSSCGSAPAGSSLSPADVYSFLQVTISGNQVTVTPTNAAGHTFDVQTYTVGSGAGGSPTTPGNVNAVATSGTSVQVSWSASTEAGSTVKSYNVYRDGASVGSVNAPTTSFTDTGVQPGTTYTYSVVAVDSAGHTSGPGTSAPVTTPGSAPPPPPAPGSGPSPTTTSCMTHLPAGSVVGSAALEDGSGYFEVDAAGDVAAFGGAACSGAMTGIPLNKPIVGMAVDPATRGYWLVASDGGIFSFNAPFFGSTGAIRLNKPIVGMAPTENGGGYWLVASDGGVFTFGNAPFFGSTGNLVLNKPVVGIGPDQDTGGYWLVASDGGIFSFNAPFFGSTGAIRLNKPVVGMIAATDGGGYRLVASDGGVFCFDEPFFGSTGNIVLNRPVIAGLSDDDTGGYWLTASDGGVFSFNAPFLGSAA